MSDSKMSMSLDDIIRTSRAQAQSKGPLQVIKSNNSKNNQNNNKGNNNNNRGSFRGRGNGRRMNRGTRGGFSRGRGNARPPFRNFNSDYEKRDNRGINNFRGRGRGQFRSRELQQVRISTLFMSNKFDMQMRLFSTF